MKTFLALLLVIGGIASYWMRIPSFGTEYPSPLVHYLLVLTGDVWIAILLHQCFTKARLDAFIFAVLATGCFASVNFFG